MLRQTPTSIFRTGGLHAILTAAALTCCAVASAQPRESQVGEFTLRSTTVASDRVDPATAARHGIEASPTTGLINAVVLRKDRDGRERTVPAAVKVTSRTLAGVVNDIEMKAVEENGRISYMGHFKFLPREVLNFEITAAPEAQPEVSLRLGYEERMWAR